jgi:predicted NUDIX family phosphoesterase
MRLLLFAWLGCGGYVTHVDLAAGRNHLVRSDRNDRRDHEARLSESDATVARRGLIAVSGGV